MSQTVSSSTEKPNGVARVVVVWGLARSSFYAARYLTAHAMKGDKERCLEAGMDGYLARPVQVSELAEAIGNLVIASCRVDERVN